MSKPPVERVAEDAFVERCALRGYWALKMEIPGWRNWPDRQVFLGNGYSFFIEFKREGQTPRPGQLHRHREMRKRGYNVYVCDTLAEALEILETEVQQQALIL